MSAATEELNSAAERLFAEISKIQEVSTFFSFSNAITFSDIARIF